MSNSDRFIEAYNKIDRYLRATLEAEKETPFGTLVAQAVRSNSTVRSYAYDLKEYADLRNAIVHERTDGHVIAEPNDLAVKSIEAITLLLTNPPKVLPLFERQVETLDKSAPVAKAVKLMSGKIFSQIPIYDGQTFVALLTTNTVALWLGKAVENDIFSLNDTAIESVLRCSEDKDNYYFLSRDATIFDALLKFQDYHNNGKRLEAVLITQDAKRTNKLLGIITIWDLTKIHQTLRV